MAHMLLMRAGSAVLCVAARILEENGVSPEYLKTLVDLLVAKRNVSSLPDCSACFPLSHFCVMGCSGPAIRVVRAGSLPPREPRFVVALPVSCFNLQIMPV